MAKKEDALSFEAALTRLEEITKKLQAGDIPLEESLLQFEEGTALIRLCRKQLDEAEQRVRLLTQDAEGNEVLVRFEEAEDA